MDDDSRALDKDWDALPRYDDGGGDAEEAVTVSISTAPGEWLVNTSESVVVPMSMAEVVEALRTGKLTDRSLVWRNGMQEWLQVDRVPQLKLAARLSSPPPRPAPRLSPPPKPARSLRSSTAPQGTPQASLTPEAPSSPRASIPAEAPSSPRASIPAEAPSSPRASIPAEAPSSPRASRPSRPSALPAPTHSRSAPPRQPVPRTALPPPPNADEPPIAVYERPAATLSFELEPEAPRPRQSLAATATPQTLAPMTTDSGSGRPPASHAADLSVVAASQFRAQRRSSQRMLWLSSLGSAAAASLLTLWLSSGSPPASGNAAVAPVVSELPPPPAPSPPTVAALPALAAQAAEPSTPAPTDSAPVKPKVKRKARAWHPPRTTPVAASTSSAPDPLGDPNPYDVKLTEDPPAAAKSTSEAPASAAVNGSAESPPASSSDSPGL